MQSSMWQQALNEDSLHQVSKNAQDKCDIIRANQDNTQRIIDTLNNHWNSDLQQRYNDARLELSQQKQNATLIAALKPAAAAA